MTKENVLRIRKLLKRSRLDPVTGKVVMNSLCISMDNLILISEDRDVVIWDDINSLLYALRSSDDISQKYKASGEILVYEYELIQTIRLNADITELKTILLPFVGKGVTAEALGTMLDEISVGNENDLSRYASFPNNLSDEDYAKYKKGDKTVLDKYK